MARVTMHSKQRIMERTDGVSNFAEAKKLAKQAKSSGKTINDFQQFEKFYNYLRNKKSQSRSCTIRVYRGNIYIWKGKDTLITAHPIPDRYVEEMEGI